MNACPKSHVGNYRFLAAVAETLPKASADIPRLVHLRAARNHELSEAFAYVVRWKLAVIAESAGRAARFYSTIVKRRIADDGSSFAVAAALPMAVCAGAGLVDM